jgi:hypothetical protein
VDVVMKSKDEKCKKSTQDWWRKDRKLINMEIRKENNRVRKKEWRERGEE